MGPKTTTKAPPDIVNPKRDDEQPATLDEAHKREGSDAVPAAPLTQPALPGEPAAPGFGQSGNVVNAPGITPGTIVQAPPPPLGAPAPVLAPRTDEVNDHGTTKRVVDGGPGVKHIEGTQVVVGGPTQQ